MKSFALLLWISTVSALAPKEFDHSEKKLSLSLGRSSFEDEWELYRLAFKKQYCKTEDRKRKWQYVNSRNWIDQHNKKYLGGEASFMLSINQFSDMSIEEVNQRQNSLLESIDFPDVSNDSISSEEGFDDEELLFSNNLPQEINWSTMQGAPEVKDQGNCGSCWAFTAATVVEYYFAKRSETCPSLSEQQLIDCTKKYGNKGCSGGLMTRAFDFIIKNGGITSNSSYPYKDEEGTCDKGHSVEATISGYKRMDKTNDHEMMKALVTHGPLCAAMDATLPSLYAYSGGIYDDCECKQKVNHGVLVVGYGSQDNKDYWIIQNSWGPLWGENGFLRIKRKDNLCGVRNLVSYPIL